MPRQIPIPSVVNAILSGFENSQNTYQEWSGGSWLWEAPEYLICSTVAKHIAEIEGAKFITLENGSTRTLEDAGARGRGRLSKDIREKGKVDILLWWGDGSPRAVIEIKNQIYSSAQYESDIKRICGFLNRNGHESSLQFGAFAFYESAFSGTRKSAKEKVDGKIERIFDKVNSIFPNQFDLSLHKSAIYEEIKNNAWGAACILIKRKYL